MEEQRARLNILKMLKYDRNDEGYKKLGIEVLKQAYSDASMKEPKHKKNDKQTTERQNKHQAIHFLRGERYFLPQLKLMCEYADISHEDIVKNARIIWKKSLASN